MNNPEKLYETAKSCLGMDMSRSAPDELGCQESVDRIHFKAFGIYINGTIDTPTLSTHEGYQILLNSPLFEEVTTPEAGDIIIAPTGYSTIGSPHGHVGICGNYGIMSNNSYTGLFDESFSYGSWDRYFRLKEGFPIYKFRKL